jgi:hypothetical protein
MLHIGVSLRQFAWPSDDALWFLGTGMGLVLADALGCLPALRHS